VTTVGNRLSDMEFDEISLVTRPANQLSKVVLFKSDTQELAKNMASKTKPIPDMDMEDEEMSEEEDEEYMKMGHPNGRKMKKNDEAIDLPSEVYEYIEALEAANAEMSDLIGKFDEAPAKSDDLDSIFKSADPRLVEIVKSAEERAATAERVAKAERNHRIEREFVSKASEFDYLPVNPERFGPILKSAAEALDAADFETLLGVLHAANTALAESGLFEEVGKSHTDLGGDEIAKAAGRIQAQFPDLTKEQAVAKAVELDPTLYHNYLRGN
jgi:hypothetical protein